MYLEDRKLKEIKHSDHRRKIVTAYEYYTDASPDQLKDEYIDWKYEYDQNFSNMKFYSITESSMAYRDTLLFGEIKGAVALDYCCGNGEMAVEMAKRGAGKVMGIDISQVAIENAKVLAESQEVEKICEFRVMDAEHTVFVDNSFDIIHEYGALHHLDLEAATSELARILRPDGKVVCTEAIRHNPLIHWYRKKTPHLRTQWEVEHILGIHDMDIVKKYFQEVNIKFFHLLELSAVPFRKTRLFKPLLSFLNKIDSLLLKNEMIGKYSWIMVFIISRPKK